MLYGIKWRNWLWVPAVIVTGFALTIQDRPHFDPLTGRGLAGSQDWIVLNSLLAGLGCFLIFRKGWRVLSPLLFLFVLVSAVPMDSKAGLKLQLINDTDAAVQATVTRTKAPSRRIDLLLLPHTNRVYRTASGDYADSLELTVAVLTNQLTSSIEILRTNQVIYTSNGLELRATVNPLQ